MSVQNAEGNHEPTGALITTADPVTGGVRLRLRGLLPVIANLTIQVRLLGRHRIELADAESCPNVHRVPNTATCAREFMIHGRLELIHALWMPETTLTTHEVVVPQRLLPKTHYLSLHAGSSDDVTHGDWHQSPRTFLLEANKCEFNLEEELQASFFWLMTRGDAAERLN